MPFDSKKRSQDAKEKPRDENGHFVPANPDIKVNANTSGGAEVMSRFIKTEKSNDEAGPMVNVSVFNPFGKMIQLLKDIKAKQATTVSLRFTIPLIALPVAFLLVFQLGRYQNECASYQRSLVGVVKNISVLEKQSSFLQKIPLLGDFYPVMEVTKHQTIIINNPEVTTVINNTNFSLEKWQDQQVILTGDYSSCRNSLNLQSIQNISLL